MASPEDPSGAKEALPKEMDEELSTDDLGRVIDQMWTARTKWYFIGVRLKIQVSDLDAIDSNNPNNVDEKFKDMIKKWLELGEGCTWKVVYDALRHHTVAQNSVAKELKKWLSSSTEGKATSGYSGQSKKIKLDESTVTVRSGPACPSVISGAATATKDRAYFASGFEIHEFDVASKYWMQVIECPQESFGHAAIENELVLVGGLDRSGAPVNKVSSFSLERKMWEEKYPPMGKARANPEVVVAGKYLIVLGGWLKEGEHNIQTSSVEVLDCEKRSCWYLNDNIKLPDELKYDMEWLSACICDKDIFIAVKHDDPEFQDTMSKFVDGNNFWNDDDDDVHYEYLDPDEKYPCYSLFRCPVGAMIEAAEAKSESQKHLWQRIEHPHPSVYENKSPYEEHNSHILHSLQNPDEADPMEELDDLQTEYNCYGVCHFTLSCINNKLIAVGCNHVKSIPHQDLSDTLHDAYLSYRNVREELCQPYIEGRADIEVHNDDETIDEECHIYVYNTEEESWKRVKSTPRNGTSDEHPSVAVVDNKLVILRNSKTVHIISFP